MFLFSKISGLFCTNETNCPPNAVIVQRQKEKTEQVIYNLICDKKFTIHQGELTMLQFFVDDPSNMERLFTLLKQPCPPKLFNAPPDCFINLLVIFHKLLSCREFQDQLAQQILDNQIEFLSKGTYYEIQVTERLLTEPSQSVSVLRSPGQQGKPETPIEISKQQQKQNQLDQRQRQKYLFRKDQQENYIKQEEPLNNRIFVSLFYNYIQKIVANFDLYKALPRLDYPESGQKFQSNLKLIWLYKLQNLMGAGIKLLEHLYPKMILAQQTIFEDLVDMQEFLCEKIDKNMDVYSTLPSSDTLSLYEIYQNTLVFNGQLQKFQTDSQSLLEFNVKIPSLKSDIELVQDFTDFVFRLKLISTNSFKRSLMVATRKNLQQIPVTDRGTFRHVKSQSQKYQIGVQEQIADNEDEEEEEKKCDINLDTIAERTLSSTKNLIMQQNNKYKNHRRFESTQVDKY